MPTTTDSSSQNRAQRSEAPDMGHALRQGLNIPVCALRASMDALTRELPEHAEQRLLLRGAIEEVERLDRNVHELIEYAQAPELHLHPASALEVLKSVKGSLSEFDCARVRQFDFTSGQRFNVDAALLANTLRRLLDNALEASTDDVLLVARKGGEQGSQLILSITNGSSKPFEAEWASEPFHTSKPNHLGLGLTLAKRDIQLHGGTLVTEQLSFGGTRILLRIPSHTETAQRGEIDYGKEVA